jgi:MoxR-like ATPase
MDRFMIRLSLGYPGVTDEINMVMSRQQANPLHALQPLMTKEQLIAMQTAVEQTYVHQQVVAYTVNLIAATRQHPLIARGASPRATLAVIALSKAVARLRGRDYVLPDDVRSVFLRAIPHRLRLSDEAVLQKQTEEDILENILSAVKSPAVI